jgi:glycosyltransferase involved in cell wall biosynthesis
VRIALLTELFSPSIGGQEIRYAEMTEALARRGHSVEVFCLRNEPGREITEAQGNVTVHRYPTAYDYQRPMLKWLRRRPYPLLRYAVWCRDIDSQAFDIFIFNQWPLAHIALAPRAIRCKAVIDWCEFRQDTLFLLLQKYFPRMVFRNIANSTALREQMQLLSGRSFEYLPSGIYPQQYRCAPATEREGLLYLGRVTQHKNLPLVLTSYEHLLKKGYTGRLRIAGTGPAIDELPDLASRLSIEDKVDFLGQVTEKEKIKLLSSSQVLILTSQREGFPRVIAEAMASGLPVVTTDYPENGAKGVVRQYGVGSVTEPSADKVSDGVLQVLQAWDLYSQAGLLASKSLDWEILIDKLLQMPAVEARRT